MFTYTIYVLCHWIAIPLLSYSLGPCQSIFLKVPKLGWERLPNWFHDMNVKIKWPANGFMLIKHIFFCAVYLPEDLTRFKPKLKHQPLPWSGQPTRSLQIRSWEANEKISRKWGFQLEPIIQDPNKSIPTCLSGQQKIGEFYYWVGPVGGPIILSYKWLWCVTFRNTNNKLNKNTVECSRFSCEKGSFFRRSLSDFA